MKLLRLTIVCSLLLLLSVTPSYALACKSCTGPEYPYCESTPDSGTRCLISYRLCETVSAPNCTGFSAQSAPPAMLAEWTVASIEISRPAEGTKIVTSPASVAEAGSHQASAQR